MYSSMMTRVTRTVKDFYKAGQKEKKEFAKFPIYIESFYLDKKTRTPYIQFRLRGKSSYCDIPAKKFLADAKLISSTHPAQATTLAWFISSNSET